jgi:hypothetical protein
MCLFANLAAISDDTIPLNHGTYYSGRQQPGVSREEHLRTLEDNLAAALPLLKRQGQLSTKARKHRAKQ